jgi:lysophospholipase L1-like esterase
MTPHPFRILSSVRFPRMIAWMSTLAAFLWVSAPSSPAQDSKPDAGILEGMKTVVLIGNGLVEESQSSGYIEALLTRRFPDRRIIFRNLGWTGDTVWGRARTSGYQNPAGLDRLKKQTAELKPDLLVVGYGLTESFDGAAGIAKFSEGYGKLLDLLVGISPRLVLLSPALHEDLGRPYPDPAEHNKSLEAYGAAIHAIADQRHLPFIDLFHPLAQAKVAAPELRLSTNGILLNDAGYWRVAREIERQLGLARPPWRIELGAKGEVLSAAGAKVSDVSATAEGLGWNCVEDQLPGPPSPAASKSAPALAELAPVLVVKGLPEGDWTLKIGGQEIVSAPARQWGSGVSLTRGPSFDQVEALRRSIVKRNDLFTKRWRPINDWPAHYTYIAPDYALYDGLVAGLDERIATESKPVTQSFSLTPKKP